MTKEPIVGRVKTRLGADIGIVPATWWYRHQLLRLVRRVSSAQWDTVLAVAPDPAYQSRMLPKVPRIPQGRGDLGARMKRLLNGVPRAPVVLIGGDIPGITALHVRHLLAELGSHDAVFGPASDGGFWAVGFNSSKPLPRTLFAGVRWSSPHALRDTLEGLGRHSVGFGETLCDVDKGADLVFATDLARGPC